VLNAAVGQRQLVRALCQKGVLRLFAVCQRLFLFSQRFSGLFLGLGGALLGFGGLAGGFLQRLNGGFAGPVGDPEADGEEQQHQNERRDHEEDLPRFRRTYDALGARKNLVYEVLNRLPCAFHRVRSFIIHLSFIECSTEDRTCQAAVSTAFVAKP